MDVVNSYSWMVLNIVQGVDKPRNLQLALAGGPGICWSDRVMFQTVILYSRVAAVIDTDIPKIEDLPDEVVLWKTFRELVEPRELTSLSLDGSVVGRKTESKITRCAGGV